MERRNSSRQGDAIWERAKLMIVIAFLAGAFLSMILANVIITIANTIA